jgi:hypothetical protein
MAPPAPARVLHRAALPLILLASAVLAGCGVQGTPQPPRIQQPERVKDLAASQIGKTIWLSFTLPRNATDGERLTKPQEVEVLRATEEANAGNDLKVFLTVSPEEIDKQKHGETIVLWLPFDDTLRPPLKIRLAVRTLTRGFRNRPHPSDISPEVSIALLEVPGAIQGLQATVTEKAIKLSWPPPAQTVTSYRILRSLTGAPDSFKQIAEPNETSYDDSDFVFDRSYFYQVSAVVKEGGSAASSDNSTTLQVTPRDTFPPNPPQGLTAVFTTDVVEIIWNASSESDLRGYFVYRKEEGLGEVRLTSEPLSTPIYRDASVARAKTYIYRVTAVDTAGNESPFSEAASAETR